MATTQQPGDTGRGSGSNGFLYFAVGALIVAVGVLGYMYYSGQTHTESAAERSADKIGDAARDIGDAAKDAAHAVPKPTPAPQPVQPTPPTTLPPG